MDFSEFGHPSQEWLTFAAASPSAARDGFTANDPAQAEDLRQSSNKARSAVSTRLMAETGLDQTVQISTLPIPSAGGHSIPLRIYKPSIGTHISGALLYFHGGGYLLGDETTDDFLCASIASKTSTVVLSVIYRHTHKYQHPAQVDDSWDAFVYIQENTSSLGISPSQGIGLMGISAGCTLAAGVVLRALRESKTHGPGLNINGVLLCIPWLTHIDNYPFHLFKSPGVSAKMQCAEAAVVPSARIKLFSNLLGADDATDELLNIVTLPDEDLEAWPKSAFLVAGMDPLRDDGLLFATRLEDLG